MHFAHGEVEGLKGKDWYHLEFRNERECLEVYLRRLIRVIPGIFKAEPAELYVPLKSRDLDEFELLEGPFVYVRSDYFIGMVRLKKSWGVVGLETRGDSRLLRDTLKVEDGYIKRLQEMEQEALRRRIENLRVGSGVRILDGTYRDFCGRVLETDGYAATVLLNLGFRKIQLTTYTINLRTIESDGNDVCWVPNLFREPEDETIQTETIQ